MKIVLTSHALAQVRRRGLSISWIEDTVREPEWRESDPSDANLERLYRSIPAMGGRVLRVVVYWRSKGECRVVTAFPDRDATARKAERRSDDP